MGFIFCLKVLKMDDKLNAINFLQDFGCSTLKQLQILFNKPNDNFKNILSNNVINQKVIYSFITLLLLLI